jgi:hypothetical protein
MHERGLTYGGDATPAGDAAVVRSDALPRCLRSPTATEGARHAQPARKSSAASSPVSQLSVKMPSIPVPKYALNAPKASP